MNPGTVFLIPTKKGLIIRDPGNIKLILPETGGFKPLYGPAGRYWRKRLKEGSVIIGNPPVISKVMKRKKKEEDK